jgi:hypothetical protein
VAIFHHSLPFLQSESFQTHVGTIHRRAIGPLALHNGTPAYTSLIRHLPAPTIECLHRPPYKLTCSSHNFRYELSLPISKESAAKYTRPHPTDLQTRLSYVSRSSKTPNPVSMEMPVYCCQRNPAACLDCYSTSIVAYLRKPRICNNIYISPVLKFSVFWAQSDCIGFMLFSE